MDNPTIPYPWCADACLVLMVTSMVCAVVRWFHVCRPYRDNADFHFPARRQTTFFYAGILMYLPYYLNPADPGAWHYAGIFGIMFYPAIVSLLIMRYFSLQKLEERINRLFFIVPMALLIVMFAAVLVDSQWFEQQLWWLQWVVGAASLTLTARLVLVTRRLQGKIREFHTQNYATEDDFPYVFANRMVWMPLAYIALMWCIVIADSRVLKFVLDLMGAIWALTFLCMILNPQRLSDQDKAAETAASTESGVSGTDDADESALDSDSPAETLPAAPYSDEVKRAVIEIILAKYKEKHLKKTEVIAEINQGMIAPASRFIAAMGYYRLINMFRLEYARLYIEAHPDAKQAEIADAAGFVSNTAYCKAKKNVQDIDRDIVSGVHL